MKNLPAIIVLLAVGMADVRAQFFSADDITSNPFAMSYGVDPQLTLFVPDTGIQILFNPARAMKYQRQFVVGKYDGYPMYSMYSLWGDIVFEEGENNYRVTIQRLTPPVSYSFTPTPTMDIAILKGDEDSYWMIQFTNIVGSYSFENNSSSSRLVSPTEQNSSVLNNNLDNNYSKTRFKISKIFSREETAYSYSVFGYYLPNTSHSIFSFTTNNFSSGNTNYKYTQTEKNFMDVKSFGPKYSLGFEFSVANEISDLILSAKVIKGKREQVQNSNSEYYRSYLYTDSTFNNISSNKRSTYYASISDPTTINLSGFYHRTVSVLGMPSNIFFSGDISYLDDDISLALKSKSEGYSKQGGTSPSGDTSLTEASGNIPKTDYDVHVSVGTITSLDLGDIIVKSGIVPQLIYSTSTSGQISYAYYSDQVLTQYDNSYYNFTVLLPLMITYSPTDWCTIFSGINTRYTVYVSKSENKALPLTIFYRSSSGVSLSYPQTIQNNGRSSNTNYSSRSSLFLNAQLQHKSGLKLQLSFKEDITRFKELGLSVMYFF